jgi:hypothetical protein
LLRGDRGATTARVKIWAKEKTFPTESGTVFCIHSASFLLSLRVLLACGTLYPEAVLAATASFEPVSNRAVLPTLSTPSRIFSYQSPTMTDTNRRNSFYNINQYFPRWIVSFFHTILYEALFKTALKMVVQAKRDVIILQRQQSSTRCAWQQCTFRADTHALGRQQLSHHSLACVCCSGLVGIRVSQHTAFRSYDVTINIPSVLCIVDVWQYRSLQFLRKRGILHDMRNVHTSMLVFKSRFNYTASRDATGSSIL